MEHEMETGIMQRMLVSCCTLNPKPCQVLDVAREKAAGGTILPRPDFVMCAAPTGSGLRV